MGQSREALRTEASRKVAVMVPVDDEQDLDYEQDPDSRDIFEVESTGFLIHWVQGGGAAER